MSSSNASSETTRRNLLKGLVATSAALAAVPVFAGKEHVHHNHHQANNYKELIRISNECAQHGDECIDHCIELFKTGDVSLARCAETVNEMIVMCRALAKMATYDSPQVKAVAKICRDVCQACADECGKHADTHSNCKACEQSCLECIKEINKLV